VIVKRTEVRIITDRLKTEEGKEVVIIVGAAIFVTGHQKTLEMGEEAVKLQVNAVGHRKVKIPPDDV
jgi:hypothetical protein